MIKRLTMWHARKGVTPEAALLRWRTDHADLVRQVPGLRRYVQNHCIDSPEGAGVPYTGLGEVWFDSFAAAAEATKTVEWSAVIADAGSFMDISTVVATWASEFELIGIDDLGSA